MRRVGVLSRIGAAFAGVFSLSRRESERRVGERRLNPDRRGRAEAERRWGADRRWRGERRTGEDRRAAA
jgi:hypothetical protein